ncbi:spermidine synthase [Bordetella genomosp. 13]|uniref:spermidine synthase n=1 Tax=Bordetella genomosp. 13 TaxID=463040 RepID=UPI0011A41902|nr:fused MFS/spermidine synthase [Bordetella genomosp. 13]
MAFPRLARRWAAALLAATACALAVALVATPAAALQVLHTEMSEYAPVVVYETDDGQRCISFGSADADARQTCIYTDGSARMPFAYTRMMMATLLAQPEPSRILIIGLGGGTLPKALSEVLPKASIDVVEIDPAVDRVAQRWFGFKTSDRLRVHHQDGRAYVEQAVRDGKQYDLVLIDAFDADYIPRHMTTLEFLQQVRALLAPGGVAAANTFSNSEFYDRESATYASVFPSVFNLRANNRVIIAVNGPLPDDEALKRNAEHWAKPLSTYGVDVTHERERFERGITFPEGTRVLRDGS